jgi:hypothetical protein
VSASPHAGLGDGEQRMPSFWLPPDTRGNGLDAGRWAEIVSVAEDEIDALFDALRAAGVPARARTPHGESQAHVYVSPDRYAQAENVVLHVRGNRPPSAGPRDDGPAEWREVKQLWWFCDGAIMDAGTRDHLWRARGLCARHSWLYFCAECELKYHPLGVAVLYEDLLGRALHELTHQHVQPLRMRALRPRATCYTCDYLATKGTGPVSFVRETEQVNAAARTRAWLDGSRPVWRERICPECSDRATGGQAVLCRAHLIERGGRSDVAGEVHYLRQLRPRLRSCVLSMTFHGPPRTPDSDGALVEALGWFAGWAPGLRYSRAGH